MDPIITAAFTGRLEEFSRLVAERKASNHPRTAPSDEPLGWQSDHNKLVRLDDAIMACHLMTARVAFKSLPGIIRQQIHALKIGILRVIGNYIIKRLAGVALRAPKFVTKEIVDFIKADAIELENEKAIRRQSIRVMRDLRTRILFKNSHRVRKTKLVFTRLDGDAEPQRRPNKRWKSPSAKP